MGRRAGSINKQLECQDCLHCKTRVFETLGDLLAWCGRKSLKPNKTWKEEVASLGRVRLIWCEKQTDRHNSHGLSPRNASPRHTASIERIMEAEKTAVFISSQSKESFITGDWDICPYKTIL